MRGILYLGQRFTPEDSLRDGCFCTRQAWAQHSWVWLCPGGRGGAALSRCCCLGEEPRSERGRGERGRRGRRKKSLFPGLHGGLAGCMPRQPSSTPVLLPHVSLGWERGWGATLACLLRPILVLWDLNLDYLSFIMFLICKM